MSYFFFLYQSLPLSLCTLFDSVSSNIGKVLSINLSANVFVFGDSRSVELCYNFSFSNDLSQMVNFPTLIPDCDSHSPALLDLFISSDASICSAMAFSHWEILIMLLSHFPLTFHQIYNGMPCLIAELMTIPVLFGAVFVII